MRFVEFTMNDGKAIVISNHVAYIKDLTSNSANGIRHAKTCIGFSGGASIYVEESYDEVVHLLLNPTWDK